LELVVTEGQAEMVKQIDTIFLAIFHSHCVCCIKICLLVNAVHHHLYCWVCLNELSPACLCGLGGVKVAILWDVTQFNKVHCTSIRAWPCWGSIQQMGVAVSYEFTLKSYQTKQHHIPRDSSVLSHYHETLTCQDGMFYHTVPAVVSTDW